MSTDRDDLAGHEIISAVGLISKRSALAARLDLSIASVAGANLIGCWLVLMGDQLVRLTAIPFNE